ncbi:MAG: hypothetical protein NXI10_01225 [bacterium]|nr:hypothetical protein [bacterium]
MKAVGRVFLDATDGGLEILKKYLSHDFTLDKTVVVDDEIRFKVIWSERYNNYAIIIDERMGSKWFNYARFNAIWFVKDKFDLSEQKTYEKIDSEMNLGILSPQKADEDSASEESPKSSLPNPLGFK